MLIHGVRFSSKDPWLSSGRKPEVWPRWLADAIPGLGVWSIEHDSAPTLWRGYAMPLVDRANNILPLLLMDERLAEGDIAFVAHSFGGLILEQILRVAHDSSPRQPDAASFIHRVSRIAFLGTPHGGADLATWAGILRLLIRPSPAARGLARNDPHLRELNAWFRRYAADNAIAIKTLIETKSTLGFLVVPPDSADPGLLSAPIPLDADHLGIASPASRESEAYLHIKNFLKAPSQSRARKRLVAHDMLQDTGTGTTTIPVIHARMETTLTTSAFASALSVAMPREFVDAEAERRLTRLRKSRFLSGARPHEQASRLATAFLTGDLVLALAITKARGVAWCARLLLGMPGHAEGPELVRAARRFADTEEVSIAEALEQSYTGDLEGAIGKLSQIESRAARAAVFITIKNNKNQEEALAWLRKSGLTLADLDSDGRFFVIAAQLDTNLFEDALASCAVLEPSDFEHTPALWYVAANAHLASVVPRELAKVILSQPPFIIGPVSLTDDVASLEKRRKARHLYQQAAVAAHEFECLESSHDATDRALLLSLRDPHERDIAINNLEQSMRSPEDSLRRLPIALQFGLKIDLETVEQEIDRQMALSANGSRDAALARFAIAQTKPPGECAGYIQQHRHELAKHLSVFFLKSIEVESLVASGQLPLAKERLEELLNHDVPSEQRARLSQLIAEAESNRTVVRERQFASTNKLTDLMLLVEALKSDRDWARLTTYAAILFERTNDLPNCELYTRTLFETAKFQDVVEFLRAHEDLLSRSEQLQSSLAWSLYKLGELGKCLDALTRLQEHRDCPEDRSLAVTLAIASGNWHSLVTFVEHEWERRADRSAEELLRAGQIAQQLTSARAPALIVEAAAKASDDPHVLLGCYSSAVAAGWEDETTVKWIERAATLSDSGGPVERVSLRDLIDRNPDWQRREAEAWDQLNAGLVPMFACARLLNRSLAELSMLPALANVDTVDPRRRMLLYSYSGARRGVSSRMPHSIAIDPTALLTAGLCGLLERITPAVNRVVVPHSTLGWLFEEKQRIRFHQPSRVANAREIRRLVDSGLLKPIEPTAPIDEQLASEVGQELARLFAEATADWGSDRRPRRVVKSAPIHRVASLMEEEADIGPHRTYVCGCLAVIDALVQQGRLTRVEERRARTFLSLHETPWPGNSVVAPGTVLYVDSVSLLSFQHLRLLPKFEASGLSLMISANQIAEGDRLIRYEALAERANAVIDHVRQVLSDGIMNGKVRLAPRLQNDDATDAALDHPAIDIIRIAGLADVAVIDDRYFNQHSDISHGGSARTPLWTTYDLLSALQLEEEQHTDYLLRMRSSALAFVPVDFDEFSVLLSRSTIVDGTLAESAEMKALREYLQLCRMSKGLTLPGESSWFENLLHVLLETIRSQWREDIDIKTAAARSTWLLELLDIRGWSHRRVSDEDRGGSHVRFRSLLVALMTFTSEASVERRNAYWEWLNDALLKDVRERQSDVFTASIQDASHLIMRSVTRLQEAHGDAN